MTRSNVPGSSSSRAAPTAMARDQEMSLRSATAYDGTFFPPSRSLRSTGAGSSASSRRTMRATAWYSSHASKTRASSAGVSTNTTLASLCCTTYAA